MCFFFLIFLELRRNFNVSEILSYLKKKFHITNILKFKISRIYYNIKQIFKPKLLSLQFCMYLQSLKFYSASLFFCKPLNGYDLINLKFKLRNHKAFKLYIIFNKSQSFIFLLTNLKALKLQFSFGLIYFL